MEACVHSSLFPWIHLLKHCNVCERLIVRLLMFISWTIAPLTCHNYNPAYKLPSQPAREKVCQMRYWHCQQDNTKGSRVTTGTAQSGWLWAVVSTDLIWTERIREQQDAGWGKILPEVFLMVFAPKLQSLTINRLHCQKQYRKIKTCMMCVNIPLYRGVQVENKCIVWMELNHHSINDWRVLFPFPIKTFLFELTIEKWMSLLELVLLVIYCLFKH